MIKKIKKSIFTVKVCKIILCFAMLFAFVVLPNLHLQSYPFSLKIFNTQKAQASNGNLAPVPDSFVTNATIQGSYIAPNDKYNAQKGWVVWQKTDMNGNPLCTDGTGQGVQFLLVATQANWNGTSSQAGSQYTVTNPLTSSSGFINPKTGAAVQATDCFFGMQRSNAGEAQDFVYRLWELNPPNGYTGNIVQSWSYNTPPQAGIYRSGGIPGCANSTTSFCGLDFYPNSSFTTGDDIDGWNFGQIKNGSSNGSLVWQKTGDSTTTPQPLGGTTWDLYYTPVGGSAQLAWKGVTDCESGTCPAGDGLDQDNRPGYFQLTNIPSSKFGTWQLVESSTPFGFIQSSSTYSVTISSNAKDGNFGTINNKKAPLFFAYKVDSSDNLITTGTPTTWTLTNTTTGKSYNFTDCVDTSPAAGCALPANEKQNSDHTAGQAVLSGELSSAGTWTLTENNPPPGYEASTTTWQSDGTNTTLGNGYYGFGEVCTGSYGAGEPFCVRNLKAPVVRWEKTDADSGKNLDGSTFSFKSSDNSINYTVTDCTSSPCTAGAGNDMDPEPGKFAIENVPTGAYTLTELTAPNGYTVNSNPISFTVSNGDVTDTVGPVKNTHVPQASWSKVDADSTSLLLPGSAWTLTQGSHSYTVVDCIASPCTAPSGSDPDYGWDRDPKAGSFSVWLPSSGNWNVTESTVPSGYTGSQPTSWQILSCSNSSVTSGCTTQIGQKKKKKIYPGLKWQKTSSSGKPLIGSEWTLTNTTTGSSWTVVDNIGDGTTCTESSTIACDIDTTPGGFKVTNVGNGVFTLKELTAPTGYLLSNTTFSTSTALSGNQSFIFSNNTIGGNPVISDLALPAVSWQKVDENTKSALTGSVWTLQGSSGTPSYTGITDCTTSPCPNLGQVGYDQNPAAGSFTVLVPDTNSYVLTETTAPTNYTPLTGIQFPVNPIADKQVNPSVVTDSNNKPYNDSSGNIFNTPTQGTLFWEKVDGLTKNPLTGSEWTLTPYSSYTNSTTNTPSVGVNPITGILDCSVAPCTGANQDPRLGFYSISVPVKDTNNAPIYWVLQETTTPDGYSNPNAALTGIPTLVSSGQVATIFNQQFCSVNQVPCPTANTNQVVTNDPIPSSVSWQKTDYSSGKIAGAEFKLCPVTSTAPNGDCNSTSETTPVIPVVDQTSSNTSSYGPCTLDNGQCDSDPGDGSFLLSTSYRGQYVLYETKAPDGYTANTKPLCIISLQPGSFQDCGAIENDANPIVTWNKMAILQSGSDPVFLQPNTVWMLTSTDNTHSIMVSDCISSPCTGADKDPAPGQFKVILDAPNLSWTLQEVTGSIPTGFVCNKTDLTPSACPVITTNSGDPLLSNKVYEFYTATTGTAPNTVNYIPNYALTPTLAWSKADPSGDPLPGSVWTLQDDSGKVLTVTDNTGDPSYTGEDTDPRPGYFLVTSIVPNNDHWTLTEAQPPVGYAPLVNPSVWNGNVTPGGDFVANNGAPIVNNSLPVISWKKTNAYDVVVQPTATPTPAPSQSFPPTEYRIELAGSEWNLVDSKGVSTPIADCVASSPSACPNYGLPGYDRNPAAGEFTVIAPTLDTYNIEETKTPTGFNPIASAIPAITISPTPNSQFDVTYSQPNKTAQAGDVQNAPIYGTLSWTKTQLNLDGTTSPITTAGTVFKLHDLAQGVTSNDTSWLVVDNNVGVTGCSNNPQTPPAGYACDSDSRIGYVLVNNVPIYIATGTFTNDYKLTEETPAPGYMMSNPPPDQTVSLSYNTTPSPLPGPSNSYSPIVNSNLVDMTWEKVDQNSLQPVSGSRWGLETTVGGQDWKTKQNIDDCIASPCSTAQWTDQDPRLGYFRVEGLPVPDAGKTYALTEGGVDYPYSANIEPDPRPSVTVSAGAVTAVGQITNEPLPMVEWHKVDSQDSGADLAGSVWTLTDDQGDRFPNIKDCVADSAKNCNPPLPGNGIDFDPRPGYFKVYVTAYGGQATPNYTLTEDTAPAGYAINSSQPVTHPVEPCESTSYSTDGCVTDFGVITNDRTYPLLQWNKTDLDGNAIAGSSWSISHDVDGTVYNVDDNVGQAGYTGLDLDPRAGYFSVTNVSNNSTASSTYTITETQAPDGFVATQPITSSTLNNTSAPYQFSNATIASNPVVVDKALPYLQWNKTDVLGKNILGGSSWILTPPAGSGLSSITVNDCVQTGTCSNTITGTDQNPNPGQFKVTVPAIGVWTIQEASPPSDLYQMDQNQYQTVSTQYDNGRTQASDTPNIYTIGTDLDEDGIGNVWNVAYPILEWEKVDSDNNSNHLAGSSWNLSELNNESKSINNILDCVADYVSSCPGPDLDPRPGYFRVELGTVSSGQTWQLTEQTPPSFYYTTTQVIPPITLNAGETKSYGTITNSHVPQVSWTKVDAYDNSILLAGSIWSLTNSSDTSKQITYSGIADCVANSANECPNYPSLGADVDPRPGYFTVNLPSSGVWTAKETTPPSGYRTNSTSQDWNVLSCNTAQSECLTNIGAITNEIATPTISIKKTDKNGNLLAGSTWSLENNTVVNKVLKSKSIKSTQKEQIKKLKADNTMQVVDNTGQTDYLTQCAKSGFFCDLDPRPGYLWIPKLTNNSAYTVSESVAPDNYLKWTGSITTPVLTDDTVYTVQTGQIKNNFVVENDLLPQLKWSKIDSQNSNLLAGSEWNLVSNNSSNTPLKVVDCVQSPCSVGSGLDQDPTPGGFSVFVPAIGVWTLTESKAPTGYELNKDSVVTPNTAVNEVYELGSITNIKVPSPTPEPPTPTPTPTNTKTPKPKPKPSPSHHKPKPKPSPSPSKTPGKNNGPNGSCSDPKYKDKKSCENHHHKWIPGKTIPAHCSNSKYKDKKSCESHHHKWIPSKKTIPAHCSNSKYKDKKSCESHNHKWIPPYTGVNLKPENQNAILPATNWLKDGLIHNAGFWVIFALMGCALGSFCYIILYANKKRKK